MYKARKPSIKPDEVRRLRKEGLGATEIARKLGVGRASVYRVLMRYDHDRPAQSMALFRRCAIVKLILLAVMGGVETWQDA